MAKNKQLKATKSILAYMGYLFQTFLKRPFGYIIAALYVVYLSVILVIVPACLHFEPLFIWNVGGFNMPIFNLFFIAASAASIAVAIFRTGRDDGTDLNLSAKPITKGAAVGVKTAVYLIIMLIVCMLTVAIVSLVKPIFGEYDVINNTTGITNEKYIGLLLSVLVGNLVNMLFFGGISVFISMIGGQVITIIGSVAIVFVMCLMNFLYPQITKSGIDVLSDKYDTEILSYSCNTLHQYNQQDAESKPFDFAAIQCITNDDGEEEFHYDTKEYWDIASKESGIQATNYIDIGKQLSNLYSSFGLDESKLQEASKLIIGANSAYNYKIDETTHITDKTNLELQNYPISFYTMKQSQGKFYPIVNIIGASMTLDTSNWYLLSTLWQVDFNSVVYVSSDADSMSVPDSIWEVYQKPWSRMNELFLSTEQNTVALQMYEAAKTSYVEQGKIAEFVPITHNVIVNDQSGVFFAPGKFDTLTPVEKQAIMTKIHLRWAVQAQLDQIDSIAKYASDNGLTASFPFSSKLIGEWYTDMVSPTDGAYKYQQKFNSEIFSLGISVDSADEKTATAFTKLVTAKMGYAETFNNLYQYNVSSFYNLSAIIAIWTVIAGCLFTGSIIAYKKTDFK